MWKFSKERFFYVMGWMWLRSIRLASFQPSSAFPLFTWREEVRRGVWDGRTGLVSSSFFRVLA